MAYVIASTCIDVKDGACQEACPVECIYEGGRMMYIQPDECIDCGLCLSVCPVDAIYAGDDLPETERAFERANAEFFGSAVTGWGSPGGAGPAPCQRARPSAGGNARPAALTQARGFR
jgi:ferredoxin